MGLMQEELLTDLERHGCTGRITPIRHLQELRQEIEGLRAAGILDEKLYQSDLSSFQFDYTEELPEAQSVIIAAIPQPITLLRLRWQGRNHAVVIPPIYVYTKADSRLGDAVLQSVSKQAGAAKRAVLPLKLLAARTGLSRYGRNNISYIEGMGSFYRLAAFVTSMPVYEDSWQAVKRMPACDDCQACLTYCPTKCIDRDRNVIHAEKCLTFLNESPEPFPDWLNSAWHNALVGCMRCQLVCPQNKHLSRLETISDVLSEPEVACVLNEANLEKLPAVTRHTLQTLNLTDYSLAVLQRNLRALFEKI